MQKGLGSRPYDCSTHNSSIFQYLCPIPKFQYLELCRYWLFLPLTPWKTSLSMCSCVCTHRAGRILRKEHLQEQLTTISSPEWVYKYSSCLTFTLPNYDVCILYQFPESKQNLAPLLYCVSWLKSTRSTGCFLFIVSLPVFSELLKYTTYKWILVSGSLLGRTQITAYTSWRATRVGTDDVVILIN